MSADAAAPEQMGVAKATEMEDLMIFHDPGGTIVFRVTPEGKFELGPTYNEQGAARRFADWVNQFLAERERTLIKRNDSPKS